MQVWEAKNMDSHGPTAGLKNDLEDLCDTFSSNSRFTSISLFPCANESDTAISDGVNKPFEAFFCSCAAPDLTQLFLGTFC